MDRLGPNRLAWIKMEMEKKKILEFRILKISHFTHLTPLIILSKTPLIAFFLVLKIATNKGHFSTIENSNPNGDPTICNIDYDIIMV